MIMDAKSAQAPAQSLPSRGDDLAQAFARIRQPDGPMGDAALAYVRFGIAVFPCCPNRKSPLVHGESEPGKKDGGLYLATTRETQIKSWWKRWPLAMVGVPMGQVTGLVAFDIDLGKVRPPEDEIEQLVTRGLELLRAAVGGVLPAPIVTRTPRGGIHLLYAAPPGVDAVNTDGKYVFGNRANLLKAKKGQYPQIDFRGQGGYVIFAPSQRRGPRATDEGCDRLFYEWDPVEGPSEDFAAGEMTPAMIDLIRKTDQPMDREPRKTKSAVSAKNPAISLADRRKRAAATRALNEEVSTLEALTDGRYNYAFVASLKLGQLVAAGLLARSVVESALENACDANGLVKKRGIEAVRIQIKNGLERGLAEPRAMPHIDEDAAHREARRSSSPRPPEPLEPENSPSEPIRRKDAAQRNSAPKKGEEPFPLPAIRGTTFAWRNFDGRPWLCTAQEKTRRDKQTGEEIPYTKYEPVSSAFHVEAWLHIAGAMRAAGLRIALLDRHGELITVDIRRSYLSRGQSSIVLERLYEAGLLIEQETTLVQILRTADPHKEITILPTAGWHELPGQADCLVFATPAGAVIGAPAKTAIELDRSAALDSAHATRGSLDEWIAIISEVFREDGVPHLRLGVMAGFAGPLLRLAGLDSCGIALSGRTTRGKTSAQKLAASVWSQQTASQPGLLKSALTTLNALEDLLQTGDGTLLALDELAQLDGKAIGKLIFEIASGTGKSRLNADGSKRHSRTWRTFVMLSSEDPLERRVVEDRGAFTEGASLRILDIDVSSVEHRDRPALFQRIPQLQAHCGHAGPRFVEELVRNGWNRCRDELRIDVLELARALVGGDAPNPALLRAAEPLAVIWKAAEFAREFGLIPTDADCERVIRWAWESFLQGAERLVRQPEERAIEALSLFIAQRWDSTIRDLDGSRPATREAEGWYDKNEICIPADLLSQASGNILPQKPLAKMLKERGLLARTEEHHNAVRFREGKNRLRVYALVRDAFAPKEAAPATEQQPQQERLPYKDS
jgi:putative DNA primase/helicase